MRIKADESAKPHFASLGIMTLPSLLIYHVAAYVYENIESYTLRGHGIKYPLRNACLLRSARSHLKIVKARNTLHASGPEFFNRLPQSVKTPPTLRSF